MDQSVAEPAETCLRLDDQLCFALYAATSAVVRAYKPLLHDIGLTYPQYVVMMALWEDEDVSVGDLGNRLGLPLGSVSPALDRLERAGLIRRHRSSVDRRVVRIALTTAGRALEELAALAAREVRCQTQLTTADVTYLRDQLKSLTAVLDAS